MENDLKKAWSDCWVVWGLLFYSIFVTGLISGLVVSLLWGWFIVPLGLPAISIFHALGIGSFFSCFLVALNLVLKSYEPQISPEEKLAALKNRILVTPLVFLLILFGGWIEYLLMGFFPNF